VATKIVCTLMLMLIVILLATPIINSAIAMYVAQAKLTRPAAVSDEDQALRDHLVPHLTVIFVFSPSAHFRGRESWRRHPHAV
jgi:sorbitol-specific phosphotransferase system component IIC